MELSSESDSETKSNSAQSSDKVTFNMGERHDESHPNHSDQPAKKETSPSSGHSNWLSYEECLLRGFVEPRKQPGSFWRKALKEPVTLGTQRFQPLPRRSVKTTAELMQSRKDDAAEASAKVQDEELANRLLHLHNKSAAREAHQGKTLLPPRRPGKKLRSLPKSPWRCGVGAELRSFLRFARRWMSSLEGSSSSSSSK